MSSKRLIELLRQEREKLNEEGARWLQEYADKAGKTKPFYRKTFFLICKDLAEHPESEWRNFREQQESIKRFLRDRGIAPAKKGWNPVSQYTSAWENWITASALEGCEESA